MRNRRNKIRGFTLVELLTTIAIMGILFSVVFVATASHKEKARDARRISELHSIKDAVDLYFSENGLYPDSLSVVASTFGGTLPTDPLTHDPYQYIKFRDTSKQYCLSAYMENRNRSGTCINSIGEPARDQYILQGP
jgi:prepilin-type N-terminal cleavage/methylation domain-containing protein